MSLSARILRFVQASAPITAAVTKFGGQPVWLEAPTWPLSRKLQRPMQFVGQIELLPEVFGDIEGRMAYFFMTIDDEVSDTWDPDAGETAIIVQPGDKPLQPCDASHVGPELAFDSRYQGMDPAGLCEFTVDLNIISEPDYVPEDQLFQRPAAEIDAVSKRWRAQKIGGAPYWWQAEQFPYADARLLFQFNDGGAVPFYVNFGAGTGYGFLNPSGTQGQFLSQC